MLQIQSLTMNFPVDGGSELRILDELSVAIKAGESVAITGPSGCGKTTLLLLLAGLEKPTDGKILLDGHSLGDLDNEALADLRRDRIGIIFQAFHLVPSLSALDNVALPLQIAGKPNSRERARGFLERVGLAERAGHHPAKLSGGEKQRVAIARAIVHEPVLLLADEPTGNLDEHTGHVVSDLLFELHRASGSAMVLATHDMQLAARCDRFLRLHEGRLQSVEVARA